MGCVLYLGSRELSEEVIFAMELTGQAGTTQDGTTEHSWKREYYAKAPEGGKEGTELA